MVVCAVDSPARRVRRTRLEGGCQHLWSEDDIEHATKATTVVFIFVAWGLTCSCAGAGQQQPHGHR